MYKLKCDCGYVAEDDDHYLVEGKMWHHAMKEHNDMLSTQNPENIAEWLRNADKSMNVKS